MNKSFAICVGLVLLMLVVGSCDERNAQKSDDLRSVEIDSIKSNILNVEGSLFSIPSPVQTATRIDRNKSPYRVDMLASNDGSKIFPTRNLKALNLGLLGIDMIYSSYYDDAQNALDYYKEVDKLAEDLEVKGAIDPNLINRIASNLSNKDSLILLSGSFYEAADVYLKNNNRPDIAVMVLSGAWIESTMLTSLSTDDVAKEALADQKQAVRTLSSLIPQIEFENNLFKTEFDSLANSFNQIETTYKYFTPETFPDERRTVIKSRSDYEMSDSIRTDIQKRLIRLHSIIND